MKDNKNKLPYNNRESSWLDFNFRVLEEAFKKTNPIIERLKFLAITASNLDEFFMVRVAGPIDKLNNYYETNNLLNSSLEDKVNTISKKTHDFINQQYTCLHKFIKPILKDEGIQFLNINELNQAQLSIVNKYFNKTLFPVLTPLAVDPSRPFPLLANKTLNIAVRLEKDGESHFAVIQVPSILPRFLELPNKLGRSFVLLEDIIISRLSDLFELHKIEATSIFRITRNYDLDIDEDTDDLLIEVQNSIKKRKRGRPVKLEIPRKCDSKTKAFLVDVLDVQKRDIYEINGPIDLTFFLKFSNLEGFEKLRFDPIQPIYPPSDFWGHEDIFQAVREKDRLVHHPYESFDIVIKFIEQAAKDKNVLAIKQTLYRISNHSPIVDALIKAAENGKQVTVLVELKARFDEENNIHWAKKLEHAGCHVVYGLTGLKTHCKMLLVVRQEKDSIRRYIHFSTGNYNEITAKIYTDIGLFTCKEKFGEDASSLFNVLTGYSRPPEYNKIIAAPNGMRETFCKMIKDEIENKKENKKSGITIKINSLVDPVIIKSLYDASNAGVEITLIVRGVCCLIPGIKDLSENIKVISIVGQFLEHSRIFKFECGGNPKIFMGSADWMPRNLDRRIELIFPIEDDEIKSRAIEILNVCLKDNTNARIQLPDMTYVDIDKKNKAKFNSQIEFIQMAKKALQDKTESQHQQIFQTSGL